jgi:hypothetical protein
MEWLKTDPKLTRCWWYSRPPYIMSLALQIGRIADEYVRNEFLVKICVVLWIDDTGGLVCGVDEKRRKDFAREIFGGTSIYLVD